MKNYTENQIREIIQKIQEGKSIKTISKETGRPYYSITCVKANFRRAQIDGNVNYKMITQVQKKVFSEFLFNKSFTIPTKNPTKKSLRNPATFEEVLDLIQVVQGIKDKTEFMNQYGRTEKRTDFLILYYKQWKKTGKIWAGHKRITDFFNQTVIQTISPAVANIEDTSGFPQLMVSDKRDPFTELDILFESFKEKMLKVLPEVTKDLVKTELKVQYDKGYEVGYKEGYDNGQQAVKKEGFCSKLKKIIIG